MINIVKTTEIPPSLAIEKGKASSKNYRCEGVISQVILDFHNKCYMCEEYGSSTLNVEHFRPHKGKRELMFAWENLFLACGHCNNLKLAGFENMLDCTNPNHKILEWIKFDIKPFPKELAIITAIANDSQTQETVELLRKVYNSENTDLKIGEAKNIRERLIKEVLAFGNLLQEYFEPTILEEEKPIALRKIRRMLSVKSSFTAFKVWVIKENETLLTEFSEFLPR